MTIFVSAVRNMCFVEIRIDFAFKNLYTMY